MIAVRVYMKVTNEPLKHTSIVLRMDVDDSETAPVLTDRAGVARFEVPVGTSRALVSGVERYHGRMDGQIPIDLWSLTKPGSDSAGMAGEFPVGSNAYSGMTTRRARIGDREFLTDSAGYLADPSDSSEGFARLLRTKGKH